MIVKINVTQEMFKEANYFNCKDCPNARAIRLVVKDEVTVSVGGNYATLNKKVIGLPRKASLIQAQPSVYDFTDGTKKWFIWEKCTPFSYELDIPEELLKVKAEKGVLTNVESL